MVSLTLAASSTAQLGNFNVGVSATSSDAGTKTLSQSVGVTVTSSQDYTVTFGAVPAASVPGQPISVQGTVTGINGYNSKVQLSCLAATAPTTTTCTVNPPAVAPGGTFTLTVNNSAVGSYTFNVQGIGTDVASITHTASVVFSFFDFAISADQSNQTVKAGQSATYGLSVAPMGLSAFPAAVTFAPCSALPSLSTCSFSPSQVSGGSGSGTVMLTISTAAAVASRGTPGQGKRNALFFAALLPLALMLGCTRARRRDQLAGCLILGVVLLLTMLQPACGGGLTGGGGSGGTPPTQPPPPQAGTTPGTYLVIITASEGSGNQQLQHSVTVTLTVQ